MATIEGGVVTQINNLVNEIELIYSTNHREVIPKLGGIRMKTKDNFVYILLDSDTHAQDGAPVIKIDYRRVTNPVTASAVALRDVIMGYVETESGDEEVMEMQVYIGKYPGHNGDFDVTRFDGDTLNIVTFPPRITEIFSDDIEFIRQIAQDGSVTAQYDRNDTAMRVNADRITVVGATFLTTDRFVVWTNIYKATPNPDLEYSPGYIGKLAGENGDFDVSYDSATTLDIDTLPPGIAEIFDADIEVIRQINAAGTVVTDYSRRNYTMTIAAGRITVTGATFGATDSFVVYTNLYRGDVAADLEYAPGYIGKLTVENGDFDVSWLDADSLTIATFPPGITEIFDADIEVIRQLDNTGAVVADFPRSNYTMTVVANVITVTGAVFANTDSFVVYTNLFKNADASSVGQYLPCWVGKPQTGNGDFIVDWVDADTLIFTTLPDGVDALYDDDIEMVRQINTAGRIVAIYKRDNHIFTMINNQLTVTGAVFVATDEFTVYTNIHKHVIVPDLELMPSYIGQPAGSNGDFDVAYTNFQTIAFANLPAGIATIFASNIEKIVVIGADGWPYKMLTPDRFRFTEVAGGMRVRGNDIYDVVFQPTDEISVYTNIPRADAGGAGGAGGGSIVYTNAAGDFVATPNVGTRTITITGLPFTLEDIHVMGGSIKRKPVAGGPITDVGLTDVIVAAGVITLADETNVFVATDVIYVTLIGPDKWYDRDQDSAKSLTQNPDYGHYTDPTALVAGELVGIYDWIWRDQGGEIDVRSYNTITLWVILTAGDEASNELRVLSKHTSAGADEYKMDTDAEYIKDLGVANTKVRYDFELDHTTPFLQVQTRSTISAVKTTSTTTTTTTPGFTRATISIKYTLGYK